jgi:hypothetical protein
MPARALTCSTAPNTFIYGVSVFLYFLKTCLYLLLALIIATAVSGALLALHYIDLLHASPDPCSWLRFHTEVWLKPNLSSIIIPVGLWFLIAVAFQSSKLNGACIFGTGLFVGLFSALFIPSTTLPLVPLYYYLIVPVAILTAYIIYFFSFLIFRAKE